MKRLMDMVGEDWGRFLRRTRVPLQYAGPIRVRFQDERRPRCMAVVQLDARARPDVADLTRVVRLEGIQKLNPCPPYYHMEKGWECMVVAMVLTEPVQCSFSFILPWLPCRESFELIRQQGFFYLTTGALDPTLFQKALRVRVPLEELTQAMTEWQSGQAGNASPTRGLIL